MLIKGFLIPQDAGEPMTKVEFDRRDINVMQGYVGGNFDVTDLAEVKTSLWFNDEGKLLEMPINYRATFLLFVYRPEFAQAGDPIVGPVLVTGMPNASGDTKGVPDEMVTLLFETDRYHVKWNFIGEKESHRQTIVFTDWPTAFEYAYQLARREPGIENVRVVPAV